MMTLEQAAARGWKVWRQDREERRHGDDETERWFAELSGRHPRCIALGPVEHVLVQVEGYERHLAGRGLRPPLEDERSSSSSAPQDRSIPSRTRQVQVSTIVPTAAA